MEKERNKGMEDEVNQINKLLDDDCLLCCDDCAILSSFQPCEACPNNKREEDE